jgi:ABC-type transport system substrate-binding protein
MGSTSAAVRLSKLTLLLVVVGAVCAVSAAQPRAAEKAPAGTLTIAVDAFDPHLLPIGNGTTQGYREDFMIFERLAEYNFQRKAVPILAESIKPDKTGRVWTVKLRKNVKFTDGKPLAAEDVVYSFLYALDPSHGFLQRGRLTAIRRIKAVNRTTVRFTLFNPLSSFIDSLTFVGIAPKHAMAPNPAAFSLKPIGTGPFVLSQFVPNDRIVLNANLKYWGGAPSVSQLIFRYMPDATTRLAALASGQVDIVAPLLATQINELRSRGGLSFKGVASTQRVDLWVKDTVAPFTNKLVRQALSYAIDRRAIVYAAAPGSTAAIGPITRASWGYDPTVKGYTYNPAKAKALLAQAGYRSGVEFELLISTRAGEDREAALIQQQAAAAGFRVRIKTMEYTSLVQQVVAKRDYQVVRITATQTPDPDSMTYIYFNSKSPGNYYGYNSPAVDRLLDQGRSIVDQDARKKVYSQLQRKLLDDAPNVWMYYNKLYFGLGPKVKNFRPLATGFLAIKTIYGADVSKAP